MAQSTGVVTMGSDLQGQGGFTQLYDPTQWDLTQDQSHVAGQATAIGISAGGISAKQLDTLKTRLENTKAQLQNLQANNLQNLTGEQISGDLLTAVIWSWFAAAESHNRLSQNQANVIENPGLSYGLFHAVANPVYSWGVVRKVTFPGVNMDIGHIRNVSWAKDNDPQKWTSYNRLRGQYMSALEHAVPERFFNDPNQCNLQGASNPTAGLPDCPQGISAVKALGLAAAQGQRIYTITRKVYNDNPNVVNTALSAHSFDTQNRVQQSLDAGYEVTIHERPITQSGWTGAGFVQIDPATGAGAYTIEGGGNGGWLEALAAVGLGLVVAISFLPLILIAAVLGPVVLGILTAMILAVAWYSAKVNLPTDSPWRAFAVDVIGGIFTTIFGGLFAGITYVALIVGIIVSILYAIVDAFIIAKNDEIINFAEFSRSKNAGNIFLLV